MTDNEEKGEVWVVSGPCKECDEYWFPLEEYEEATTYACDWMEERSNFLGAVGDEVTIKMERRQVSKKEADALDD